MSEFKKLTRPSFGGTTNPLEAKWLAEMEKDFHTLRSTDAEKVTYAICMLQGDAYDWWLMVNHQHEQDTEPFS